MSKIVIKNGLRHYMTPIGVLPSVSTINNFKSDTYFLEKWARDLAEMVKLEIDAYNWGMSNELPIAVQESIETRKPVSQLIFENSCERGTKFHEDLEHYLRTGEFNDFNVLLRIAEDFINTLDLNKNIQTELFLWSKKGYAGTCDCVATINNKLVIIDWKNSRKIKERNGVQAYLKQLSAYWNAYEERYNIEIDHGIVAMSIAPDRYSPFTDPHKTIPETFKQFKLTRKQKDKHFTTFLNKLQEFKEDPINQDFISPF